MAIAFDAGSDGGRSTATSITFAHTCTGADLLLLVGVLHGAADTSIAVTYNGVAMTQYDEQLNHAANYRLTLFYLYAPATGTHNIVVTPQPILSDMMPVAASFTGVSQTGFPDAYNGYTSTTGNATKTETITTVAANCWMVWFGLDEFGTTETAGSSTTLRVVNSGYGGVFLADSGGSVGAAGAHSLNIVVSNSADYMNDMVVSLAPSAAAGRTTKNTRAFPLGTEVGMNWQGA